MAEVTTIITAEFTKVTKNLKNNEYLQKRGFGQWIESRLKEKNGGFDDIKVVKVQVFEFPDQPKALKLTKRERDFCEFMKCGWIARDKEKNLYWYNSKPYKNETTWNNNNSEYICMDLLNTPFAFIQWEDDEPWDVSELRKLEVEE